MHARRGLTAAVCIAGSAVLAGVLSAGAASAQSSPPVNYDFASGFLSTYSSPTVPPPGANYWSCRPTAQHPYPVVLVHGTIENMNDNWQAASPILASHGYCVFALNYGGGSPADNVQGTGEIATSAQQLASFVDRVLAATGASKVDIVGHSQGGMMPRYYLRFLDGADSVQTLVGLAPSNHGTTLEGLFTLAGYFPGATGFFGLCPACEQQAAGSAFLEELNAGSETVPGVSYTVIESANDEVVTPYSSAFMSGASVTNILLQQQCPLDQGEHLSMPYDHIVDADVLNALDPGHHVPIVCTPVLPVIGG
jgi:triacylglycerol esterase/lipase EstA (alpha/beta hydrolase family)